MVTPLEVSELFDSELAREQLEPLLGAIAPDPLLRDRWTIYSMISDTLAGVPWPDDGYSQRICDRLHGVEMDSAYDPLKP